MHTNLHSEIYSSSSYKPELRKREKEKRLERLTILAVITGLLIAIACFYYDWNYPREAIPSVHAQVMKQLSVKYWEVKDHLKE